MALSFSLSLVAFGGCGMRKEDAERRDKALQSRSIDECKLPLMDAREKAHDIVLCLFLFTRHKQGTCAITTGGGGRARVGENCVTARCVIHA